MGLTISPYGIFWSGFFVSKSSDSFPSVSISDVKRADLRSSWESVLLPSHLLHGFLLLLLTASTVYPRAARLSIRKTAKDMSENSGRIPLESHLTDVLY